ncbi:MAG: histidine phosphatase family protein [Thermoleophilaceae bacterium]|nr:histidine phosphatase family protein [Thermoleophilaceae bacterium]
MNEPRGQVVLIRHGETAWSLSKQHTGRTDIPLTENGRAQARTVAPRLIGRTFGRVLSSPLSRARETCELAGLGGQAETREDLLEWDYGDYDGLTTAEIRETVPDWTLWRDGCPNGEQAEDVGARCDRLIAELRSEPGDTALFAHGHVLRVIAACWAQLGPQAGARLALSTATMSVLGWEREIPVIWLWNDGSHLGP